MEKLISFFLLFSYLISIYGEIYPNKNTMKNIKLVSLTSIVQRRLSQFINYHYVVTLTIWNSSDLPPEQDWKMKVAQTVTNRSCYYSGERKF